MSSMSVPHAVPFAWPSVRPSRLAATLTQGSAEGCRCALLGLPDDLGVTLNAGRAGARRGPAAFRNALASFGGVFDGLGARGLDIGVLDAGDVQPAPGDGVAALLETHRRVEEAVAHLHQLGLVTVCVGGGHDLSLPSLSALSRDKGHTLGGINVDAHLDVRESPGSGMPFRQLIEGRLLDPARFVELGLGRFANEQRHLEWLKERGARLIFADRVLDAGIDADTLLTKVGAGGPAFVSVDLDAFDQSLAPGVSAPNPLGLPLHPVACLVEAAGRCEAVQHVDFMELNPDYDRDGCTARLAAALFLRFVAGLSVRPQ